MSNETKRDVFEDALSALEEFGEQGSSWEMAYDDLRARYSAASDIALPDDLPLIPECVNYAIEWFNKNDDDLGEVFRNAYEDLVDDWHECPQLEVAETWIINHPDEFARVMMFGFKVSEQKFRLPLKKLPTFGPQMYIWYNKEANEFDASPNLTLTFTEQELDDSNVPEWVKQLPREYVEE
ncbi:DUF1642 domain-containing protein [Paucilactobacillus sp. N302-9]